MGVKIGRHTYGENNIEIHFQVDDTPEISIGHFCSIADNIDIFVGGNHPWTWGSTFPFGIISTHAFPVPPKDGVSPSKGPVHIGNDVWIGSGATIMSGVTVGDGAVIAANAHVIKDIGPYEIWGGNPARFIRTRFDERFIQEFLAMQWWNYPDEVVLQLLPYLQQEPSDETITAMWNIIN